jgi:MoxR-like ATPase
MRTTEVAEEDLDLDDGGSLEEAARICNGLRSNLAKVLLGAKGALGASVVAALSGGHLLIEDVPGVGKTLLAKALARSLGCGLSRVQGHPDLMPSDVLGVSVYLPGQATWELRPGPVFSRVLLFDELNRTPPRTQSALLEAMEEGQVTIDGETIPLPCPQMVIATENPVEDLGTFPLVESQRDRFALATSIGYPDQATEAKVALEQGGPGALDTLEAVCDPKAWAAAQAATRSIHVAEKVASYAVSICDATRRHPGVRLGASPRASIWLLRAARAYALGAGRDFVAPADVKAVAPACLAHRLVTNGGMQGALAVVLAILEALPAPRP